MGFPLYKPYPYSLYIGEDSSILGTNEKFGDQLVMFHPQFWGRWQGTHLGAWRLSALQKIPTMAWGHRDGEVGQLGMLWQPSCELQEADGILV